MRAEWRWGAEKHLDSFVYILVVYFFSPRVTGAIYEFNSKTGARKWKEIGSLNHCLLFGTELPANQEQTSHVVKK